MRSKFFSILKSYLLGWFIANVVWFLGTSVNENQTDFFNQGGLGTLLVFFLLTWLFQGAFYGVLFGLIESFIKGRVPFLRLQFIVLFSQTLMAVILVLSLFQLFKVIDVVKVDTKIADFINDFPGVWLGFVFALIVNFTINLLIHIDWILGKGNLLNLIKGKFYHPKVANQIFMFLDLKGSTTLAERLGNVKYSELIQDCFYDLAVVARFGAKVYQYVGDEAVLTWNLENGLKNNNCIKAFYAFERQLQKKEAYYLLKYNEKPIFKAGLNIGTITVTEVGELKREIAYHGDTINIAARIQGECNKLGTNLMISEMLFNNLVDDTTLSMKFEGKVLLRGKTGQVGMYSVQRTPQAQ
ncbi:adenylate/guanylate cyclase domain-containing protein [uncultured Croceitalea sp.]|uniref:adenylate/guanylate cyclase domain-containing protein n=1 Tax=uncultured Croceitalea sp. TaxID=1798908 RepID=UPI00374F1B8A